MKKNLPHAHQGMALIIAILFASVALSIGLSLAALGSEELSISTTQQQSRTALDSADSMLECVLYADKVENSFIPGDASPITCTDASGIPQTIMVDNVDNRFDSSGSNNSSGSGSWYSVAGGGCAQFTVLKTETVQGSPEFGYTTDVYIRGKNAGRGGDCSVDASQTVEKSITIIRNP